MADPPDRTQLESLVRRFSRLVRTAAARVGGSPGRQIADYVEQQVFLNIWKQLEREQSIDNPASYIYKCAVRETIRLLRAQRRGETLEGPDAETVAGPAPGDVAASREQRELLAEAIKTLSVDRRRAVQAYLAGFSVPEMMTMYGWSYERARNLSTRGMADLRAALKERGIDG
jgi:RNA polymerase sigma factor (sigma-70 family)